MKKKEILTLISQKSEIFASFPQGKPFGASHQQLDKWEFERLVERLIKFPEIVIDSLRFR